MSNSNNNSILEDIKKEFPLKTWLGLALIIMALVSAFLFWSAKTELDQVITVTGVVRPFGEYPIIQHLEGGIITEIYVEEGDEVHAGDRLLQLDLGTTGLSEADISIRADTLELQKARLEAEISYYNELHNNGEIIDPESDFSIDYPIIAANNRPQIIAAENRNFRQRRAELASLMQTHQDRLHQEERSLDENSTARTSARRNLNLAKEQYNLAIGLQERQLISDMEVLSLSRDVAQLEGTLANLNAARPRIEAEIDEAHSRASQALLQFIRNAGEELTAVEIEIAHTEDLRNRANDQAARTEIISPVDGIVANLAFNTVGGIIRGGEPILEIVPIGQSLLIEARIRPIDIGSIEVGMPVIVKISTYDFLRYGALEGTVTQISAKSDIDENGAPYFRLLIETEADHLENGDEILPISSGMEAITDIHIGRQPVWRYIIQPILKLKTEAFREG